MTLRSGLPRRQTLLLLLDLAVLSVALLGSHLLRLPGSPEAQGGLPAIARERGGAAATYVVASLFFLYLFGACDPGAASARKTIMSVALAFGAATAAQASVYYAVGVWRESDDWVVGRGLFALQQLLGAGGCAAVRLLLGAFGPRLPLRRRVLVVGAGPAAQALADECAGDKHPDYVLDAFISDLPGDAPAAVGGAPVLPRPASLRELTEARQADLVIVALTDVEDRSADLVRDVLSCKVAGFPVLDMPDFFKSLTGRVPITHVGHHWFLFGSGFDIFTRPVLRNFLRLMDVGSAVVGLFGLLPLWILVGLLVKLTSRGPALYTQTRLGQGKRPYTILKFRTMRTDAEKDGAKWASVGDDPRVTWLGRILRRTRIDEVPQLWNVLKGEMSLIGPRPERPEFVETLEKEIPFYDLRFAVPPGLTGWAQVNYGYGSSVEDAAVKLQYDLYYIQENSILLNLKILLRTVRTVLFRSGS